MIDYIPKKMRSPFYKKETERFDEFLTKAYDKKYPRKNHYNIDYHLTKNEYKIAVNSYHCSSLRKDIKLLKDFISKEYSVLYKIEIAFCNIMKFDFKNWTQMFVPKKIGYGLEITLIKKDSLNPHVGTYSVDVKNFHKKYLNTIIGTLFEENIAKRILHKFKLKNRKSILKNLKNGNKK